MKRAAYWILPFALLTALAPAGLQAQDPGKDKEEEKRREEPDPEIEAKLEKFEDCLKDRKRERDGEAAEIVREIVEEQTKLRLCERDERDVVRSFAKAFAGPVREPDKAVVYLEIAKALGKFGEYGAEVAVTIYGNEQFDDDEWAELRKKLLESIGESESLRHYELLIKEASNAPEDYIKAHAGLALRHYTKAPAKVREEIVKRIIRNYAKIDTQTRTVDPNDAVAARMRQTLRAIQDPWNLMLGELTGEAHRTAPDWVHWYNKNKDTWTRERDRG
jgi:hypothetical protein